MVRTSAQAGPRLIPGSLFRVGQLPVGQTKQMARVDPVERVLNLLALLHETSQPLTRAQIAAKMARGATPYSGDTEALHQQFSADRRTLTLGLGVVIHQRVKGGSEAGQTEYWIDPAELRLPELHLDPEEQLVVALALAAVRRSVPLAGEAALKLSPMWAPSSPIDFVIDLPDPVVLVMEAAKLSHVIHINVRGEQRVIEPWAVILIRGSWQVWGHLVATESPSHTGGVEAQPTLLRIDERSYPTVLSGRVRQVVAQHLDAAHIPTLVRQGPPDSMVAEIHVSEVAAVRAALSPMVLQRSEVEGGVRLEVRVDDRAALRTWLLSLGPAATLVGPEELREEFRAWLTAITNNLPSGRPAPERPGSEGRRRGPEPVAARLHRLLSIVPWLYQQQSVPVAEIARSVGAQVSQVVRDLTLASMCGVPPYTADLLFGFWVEPDPETAEPIVHVARPTMMSAPLRLTVRQAAAVSVALNALAALPGEDSDAVQRVREKLATALGEHPVRVTFDDPPLLSRVREAVEGVERLVITYVNLDDEVTERTVDPLKLFIDRGRAYLLCHDHLREDTRVFRVDRLVAVEGTGTNFEPRDLPVPAGAVWEWMIPDREVVVRLPAGSDWVLDRYAVTAHVDEPDGGIVCWLSVVSQSWLAGLLLACGPDAEVIAPVDLHTISRDRAAALLDRYQ
jgi:predicted DNA-binding transcriptional regulator YafY